MNAGDNICNDIFQVLLERKKKTTYTDEIMSATDKINSNKRKHQAVTHPLEQPMCTYKAQTQYSMFSKLLHRRNINLLFIVLNTAAVNKVNQGPHNN